MFAWPTKQVVGIQESLYKGHPEMQLYVRGDSGFVVPEFYELLEKMAYSYGIRLKSNKALVTQSWLLEKPRRVLVKPEKLSGEMTIRHTLIVINMSLAPK